MEFNKKDLLLYAVTDRRWLKEGETLYGQAQKALKGGVTMLQIREKNLDAERFMQEALAIQRLCRQYHVPLIINDNVDVALAVDADGIHVGQSDMEAGAVRKKLGPDKIIGVSARNKEEALAAQENGADYLGVGAVFPTGSKDDAQDVSLTALREICEAVRIPSVAIGGITKENLGRLSGTGISGIAVISAIFAQEDIQGAAGELYRKVSDIVGL